MNQQFAPPHGIPAARELPSNIEAEQAILGALFVRNDTLDKVPTLAPEHFSDPLHQQIFAASRRLIEKGQLANAVTLRPFFDDYEPIPPDPAGTPPVPVWEYLGRLRWKAANFREIRAYAQTVHDLYIRRELVLIAEGLHDAAHFVDVETSPAALLDEAESRLDRLRTHGSHERGPVKLADAMRGAIDDANAAHMRGDGLVGLSTGIASLDAVLGGLAPSDLVVIGARPGMGKSALAGNIGINVANAGHGVAFYSLEMSSKQLGTRTIASVTGISADSIRRGKFDGEVDMRAMRDSAAAHEDVPFYIDESGGLTIAQMAVKARRLCRQHKIELLIVDYVQIMSGADRHRQANRVQEITEITTGLKALAKELDVTILLLSQLNRGVEGRENKRPGLADLKESGSIEQDADVVLFLYRDEYYLANSKPGTEADQAEIDTWLREMKAVAGKAEVIIAKHRHAPPNCTVDLHFDGARTLFTDRG